MKYRIIMDVDVRDRNPLIAKATEGFSVDDWNEWNDLDGDGDQVLSALLALADRSIVEIDGLSINSTEVERLSKNVIDYDGHRYSVIAPDGIVISTHPTFEDALAANVLYTQRGLT